MSQTTEKRSHFARFAGWVAELVLVFIGVYAAFWLSNFQQHQQDAERRDRILASIEQTLRQGIESGKIAGAKQEPASGQVPTRARCRRNAAAASLCFHDRLQPGRLGHAAAIRRRSIARRENAHGLAQHESVIRWGLERHGSATRN